MNKQYTVPTGNTPGSGGGGGGSGTVTSVGLADSTNTFTITGSPVTTSGTLTLSAFANQTANTVLAGPTSGGAAPSSFRSLVAADIPNLAASKITSGTLAVAQGGTNLASGTSGGILGYTASGTLASSGALTANAIVLGGGAGATPSVLGSLGTTTTVLHGNAGGAPTFGAVVLTTDVSGTLPAANGGVALTSGAGGGGFWGGIVFNPYAASEAANAIVGSNNQVVVCEFVLPFTATISVVNYQIGTTQAASTGDLGIYNSSGTLVANTGGFSTAAGVVVSTALTQGTVTLPPGTYYFAQTNSNSGVTMRSYTFQGGPQNIINANSTKRWGTATAATAGVLPNSMGTITTSNSNILALAFFCNG